MQLRPIIALVSLAMLLALLSVFQPGARAQDRVLPTHERQEIARAIEREVRAAYDLSRPDVVERLLALYPPTDRIVSAAGGRMLTSRDSLESGIRYFWNNVGRNMQEPRWEWEEMEIDVLSRDAAVMTATYRVPHLTPDGRPHELGGAMTAVFLRQGEHWRIVQEHLSDLPQDGAAPDTTMLTAPGTAP